MEVAHAAEPAGQLRQLVEVGGEEDLGAAGTIVQLLHHRPRDGQAVEGGGAAADLVQQHQATRREVVQDRRRLHHLDQERRLAAREVVLRAHAGEDPIDQPQPRRAGRHERAHLGQHDDVAGLAEVDRLARHVGPGQDHDAGVVVEREVVGRHRLAGARLQHRMAALDDLQRAVGHDHGAHVAARRGPPRPGAATTSSVASARGGGQQIAGSRRHPPAQLVEQLVLEPATALIGAQDLGLVILQLGRHVALGPGEGLAAHVLGRGPGGLGVGDLDAVAEDPVVAHAQTATAPCARARALPGRRSTAGPRRRRSTSACSASFQLSRMMPPSCSVAGGSSTSAACRVARRSARSASAVRASASSGAARVALASRTASSGARHPRRPTRSRAWATPRVARLVSRARSPTGFSRRRSAVRASGRLDQGGDRVVTGADRGGAEQRLQHPLP